MGTLTNAYIAQRAARDERDVFLAMIRQRIDVLTAIPHDGGPVSGGLAELSAMALWVSSREKAAPCEHVWQTGAVMENPLAAAIYECAICGTHITESEMRSLDGDR